MGILCRLGLHQWLYHWSEYNRQWVSYLGRRECMRCVRKEQEQPFWPYLGDIRWVEIDDRRQS